MINKKLINHRRKRKIPPHFSWVDHNLIRDGYCRLCSTEALGLYLFLLTVSDSEGLSFYGDKSISMEINCSTDSVACLRRELVKAGLIAYRNRIYQVLDLSKPETVSAGKSEIEGTHSMNDILEKMFGGTDND